MGTSTLQPCSTYSYSWMNIRTFWSGTRVSCKNMATAPLTDQTPSDFMIFAVAVPTSTWDEMRASRVSLLEQNQVDFLILIQHKSPRCCWNILEQIVNDRCKMRKAIGKHNLTAWNHHMRSRFYCEACNWKQHLTSLLAGFSRWIAAFCRSC